MSLQAGLLAYQQGDYGAAAAQWRAALRDQPGDRTLLLNLGAALNRSDDLAGAIACYGQILAQTPEDADARHNLANALERQGAIVEAEGHLRWLVDRQPQNPAAWHSLGDVLAQQNRTEDAIVQFNRALALDPELAQAHLSRALAWLKQGDLARGWAEYEWRWRCPAIVSTLPAGLLRRPLWLGPAPPDAASPFAAERLAAPPPDPAAPIVTHVTWGEIRGQTVLVHGEIGLGDTIQFVRYLRVLAARGARVVLGCPPSLARLLAGVAGVDCLVSWNQPVPAFDCWLPVMSLPTVLGIATVDSPIAPYLSPPALPKLPDADLPVIRDPVAEANAPRPRKTLGVVWRSGPGATQGQRSCPLELFLRLLDPPSPQEPAFSLQAFSLQKDPTAAERAQLAARQIVDLSPWLEDLAATAAIVGQLDLVITVDTAVAHLAGAIASPVWVVLPWAHDWRWGSGTQTPWYPTARLFRQPALGDWPGAIAALRREFGTGN